MKNSKRLILALVPVALAIGVIAGIFAGEYIGRPETSKENSKLKAILELIDNEYVDKVDIDSLIELSLPDLMAQLDPHSVYIPAAEFHAANDDLEGSFSGVGISFQILNDTVTVVEVISGGPAEKVGIQNGDRIIRANGKSMTGAEVTNEDVFKSLRGAEGSKVVLDIKRNGVAKPLKFDVIRGAIPVTSVDAAYMMADGIGYVKVNKFAKTTAAEFLTSLNGLNKQGARKFVIDLRGNTGGLLDQAILMANEFLPAGKMIVYTKGRNPLNESVAISDGNGSYQNNELVVITDEGSASASEIFAGAIQDNDRGLVIGRRTFGKGLVQNQVVLPDSSAVRLTVARYYTPSGRSIQKEYTRGKDGKYDQDIVDRYNHGEFYNIDSIKLDKSKRFLTANGRTVYGGGGIMPDIFVPQDTTGYTTYYMNVMNQGLIQKFSFDLTDRYRSLLKNVTGVKQMLRVIPGDDMLLQNFADYAANNGEPARWYYINKSRDVLLRQLKAVIARDALGYGKFYEILNENDPVLLKAVDVLNSGKSPILIKK